MRSHNFFKMLRLISCRARRGATATPGTWFGFREVARMAVWLLLFAVEFMMKNLGYLSGGS